MIRTQQQQFLKDRKFFEDLIKIQRDGWESDNRLYKDHLSEVLFLFVVSDFNFSIDSRVSEFSGFPEISEIFFEMFRSWSEFWNLRRRSDFSTVPRQNWV